MYASGLRGSLIRSVKLRPLGRAAHWFDLNSTFLAAAASLDHRQGFAASQAPAGELSSPINGLENGIAA